MNNNKNPQSKLKTLFLITLAFVITLVSLKIYYNHAIQTPLSNNSKQEEFVIKRGESVNSVLNSLEQAGYLNKEQKLLMKIYIKLNKLDNKIEAGTFYIPHNLNIKELAQTIQNGKYKSVWITVPSGLRADEICDTIGEELKDVDPKFDSNECIKLTKDENFIKEQNLPFTQGIKTLEGMLYPDKYLIPQNASTTKVLEILLDNFKKNLPSSFTYNDLIIASLLEKEGIDLEDKKIISGIIRKRLQEGWLLQVDATILYYKNDWKHTITPADIKEDEPYNTYQNLGLPPTPICNVTKEDMEASINPTKTDYYYYLHDKNQQPHYSKTNAEHAKNINTYLY